MIEYIERAALKERFQKRLIWLKKDVHDEYSKGLYHGCETDMGLIDEILAADVVEMRHGYWVKPVPGDGEDYCSVCHAEAPWFYGYGHYEPDYCPNCGARMEKEDEP